MIRRKAFHLPKVWACAFLLSLGALSWAAVAKDPYRIQVARRPVSGKALQIFEFSAQYPYAQEAAWTVGTDFPKFTGVLKEVKEVRVIAQSPDRSVVKVVVDLPKMLPTITTILEVTHKAGEQRIAWQMLEGKGIKSNEGYVLIRDHEGKTKVEGQVDLRAGAWIPQFLVDHELQKMLPKLLRRFGGRVAAAHRRSVRKQLKPLPRMRVM